MRKCVFILGAALLFMLFGISQAAKIIEWYEAPKYYGQWVTVKGKVVSTENTGQVVFLNFGSNKGKNFLVLIFRPSFHRFPDKPEDLYYGKEILVTGKVKKYKGVHSITIPSASRIQIVGKDEAEVKKKAY